MDKFVVGYLSPTVKRKFMDLIRQNLDSHAPLLYSIFILIALMLTVESFAYSTYSDDAARSTEQTNTSGSINNLLLRVSTSNKRRVKKSQTQQSDFSVSWDKIISQQTKVQNAGQVLSSQRLSYKPSETKRSMKIVSRHLLQKYRSDIGILPAGWPLKQGRVSSKFGWRRGRMHKGIDIAAKKGTPIFTVEDGVVVRSKYVRGYGRLVEIKHSDMYSTRYGHNSKNLVKAGQKVKKGQMIALVGSTGRSTGPHLHFEIRQNGVAINPIKYLGAMDSFSLAENLKLSKFVKLSKK
jgi:murein DD-endopeptidase MepM/ murein hydrolase activator NlpD